MRDCLFTYKGQSVSTSHISTVPKFKFPHVRSSVNPAPNEDKTIETYRLTSTTNSPSCEEFGITAHERRKVSDASSNATESSLALPAAALTFELTDLG